MSVRFCERVHEAFDLEGLAKEVQKYTLSTVWSIFLNIVTLGFIPWVCSFMRERAVAKLENAVVIETGIDQKLKTAIKSHNLPVEKLCLGFALMLLSQSQRLQLQQIKGLCFFDKLPEDFKKLCNNLGNCEIIEDIMLDVKKDFLEISQSFESDGIEALASFVMKEGFSSKTERDGFIRLFNYVNKIKINFPHIEYAFKWTDGKTNPDLKSLLEGIHGISNGENSPEIIDIPESRTEMNVAAQITDRIYQRIRNS